MQKMWVVGDYIFDLSNSELVGGWTNPFEKYESVKLDHETPRFGVKIKKYFFKPPSSPKETTI